ncbi:MAG: sulfite exporter TauE/SafE family protein [Flavobacteriaceae bacterium]|nr:sulfite exporter TauE/SafE family protein [Flavobacteriaceae bacterium]
MQEWYHYLLLIGIGFVVGIINTISGGGSLLTLPILIFVGLDSATANGTNRIAIFVQSIFSLLGFRSKGATNKYIPLGWKLAIVATLGAILGSTIAIDINDGLFKKVLAIVMIVIVVFMVFKPKKNLLLLQERISGKHQVYSIIAFFFIGVYGGFIQAGTGIFILLTLSTINQLSLINSNILKVMVMLVYTLFSLLVFWVNEKLHWEIGLTMAIGQAAGGWLMGRWSVNKGDEVVKFFLITMVILMAIKLWFFSD